MTTQPQQNTIATNIKTNAKLVSLMVQLRETTTLNNLQYTNEVMHSIKKIPKITSPPKTVKLSSIIPETQEEEPETVPQTQPTFATRIRSKLRGKKRTH